MNRREFLKKSLECIIVSVPLIYNCGKDPSSPEVYDPVTLRTRFHGYWIATSGDTKVSGEIGLIVYNGYRIDTSTYDDDVIVIWDDGLTSRESIADMKNDIVEFQVLNVKAQFETKNHNEATAYFNSNGKSYKKELKKIGENPSLGASL